MVNAASLVNPSMICLKHYRAASDGWRDGSNCDTCVENYTSRVGSKCGCDRTEDCSCRLCLRQPPSLFSTALDVYTRLVPHLPEYELTSNTTYEQYVHAVESEQSDIRLLLPPEYRKYEYGFDSQPLTLIADFTVIAPAMVTGIRRPAVPLQTFSMPSTIS